MPVLDWPKQSVVDYAARKKKKREKRNKQSYSHLSPRRSLSTPSVTHSLRFSLSLSLFFPRFLSLSLSPDFSLFPFSQSPIYSFPPITNTVPGLGLNEPRILGITTTLPPPFWPHSLVVFGKPHRHCYHLSASSIEICAALCKSSSCSKTNFNSTTEAV